MRCLWFRAAGAGRQCAPAALIGRGRAAPQLTVRRRYVERITLKRPVAVVLALVGIAAAAVVVILGYLAYSLDVPIATHVATSGKIGDVTIGDTKEAILAKLASQAFSLDPKPAECPLTWIKVAEMSLTQRGCLMSVDRWDEGDPSTRALCPENTDVFTVLHFEGDRLQSVTTTCMHPQ